MPCFMCKQGKFRNINLLSITKDAYITRMIKKRGAMFISLEKAYVGKKYKSKFHVILLQNINFK